jgi:hypothetical protein
MYPGHYIPNASIPKGSGISTAIERHPDRRSSSSKFATDPNPNSIGSRCALEIDGLGALVIRTLPNEIGLAEPDRLAIFTKDEILFD